MNENLAKLIVFGVLGGVAKAFFGRPINYITNVITAEDEPEKKDEEK